MSTLDAFLLSFFVDPTQAKKKTVDVLAAADMGIDLKPRNTVVEVTFAACSSCLSFSTLPLYRN